MAMVIRKYLAVGLAALFLSTVPQAIARQAACSPPCFAPQMVMTGAIG